MASVVPDMAPLGSAELAELFAGGPSQELVGLGSGPYQAMDQTPAWLLDTSPSASGDPLFGGLMDGVDSGSPTAVAGDTPLDYLGNGSSMPINFLGNAGSGSSSGGVNGAGAFQLLDPALFSNLPGLVPLDGMGSGAGFAPAVAGAAPAAGLSGGRFVIDSSLIPPVTFTAAAADSGAGSAAGGSGGDAGATSRTVAAGRNGRGKAGGTAGGKGGKKELTEEQKERIKAKNRRAQNRYREKQKAKAAAAEAEYHDTAAELERMRLENMRLQERKVVMEQVLTVREQHMSLLQESKAASEQEVAAAAAAAVAAEPAAGHLPSICDSAAEQSNGCTQQAGAKLALCGSSGPSLALAPGGNAKLACPLTGLTLSQIAELKGSPPETLQREWKGIAMRLSAILQQLQAAENSADSSLVVQQEQLRGQVEATLREGQAFCFEHAVYQPTNVQKLFAASLDDGRSQISADDLHHWAGVASALHLSAKQLERLAAARAQFLQRIDEVVAERRAIFDRLQAVEVPTSLRAMQHATASWLEVHEATSDLTANMNEEHCVCMAFVRDAFGFTLTPHQKAVAIVRSYPFFPDMFSISTVALDAAGHPELNALGGSSDSATHAGRLLAGPAALVAAAAVTTAAAAAPSAATDAPGAAGQ